MQPEAYLERVYDCLEKAKRTRDQTQRQQWIEDAVTWHTIARIAEDICADSEPSAPDRSRAARAHEHGAPGFRGVLRG